MTHQERRAVALGCARRCSSSGRDGARTGRLVRRASRQLAGLPRVRKKAGRPGREARSRNTASVEVDRGAEAAEESFAQRAYPADDIPIQLSQNAQNAWSSREVRGIGQGKNKPGPVGDHRAEPREHAGAARLLRRGLHDLGPRSPRSRSIRPARSRSAASGSARPAAASGGLRTGLAGSADVGVRLGRPAVERDRRARVRRCDRHALRRHRRAERLGGQRGRRSASSSRPTAATTWTMLAGDHDRRRSRASYTGDAFKDRAISEITVDPTNPNVIYVASAQRHSRRLLGAERLRRRARRRRSRPRRLQEHRRRRDVHVC